MMKQLAKRVKAMLGERNWSMYELQNRSGLNGARISDIVKGRTENPRLDTLQKLATAFECSIDYLANGRTPRDGSPKKDDVVTVPVMIAVDPPAREPQHMAEELHALAAGKYKEGRRLVRIVGKSMWPRFHPNDLLLMDSGEKVRDGDDAVVRWGGRVIVAKVRFDGNEGNVLLEFANSHNWPAVEPGGSAKIVGKIVEVIEGVGSWPHSD